MELFIIFLSLLSSLKVGIQYVVSLSHFLLPKELNLNPKLTEIREYHLGLRNIVKND